MALEVEAAQPPGVFSRARDLILKPQAEWDTIAAEPEENPYLRYALPLALLAALAHVVGYSFLGGYETKSLFANLIGVSLQLLGTLANLYIVARFANALAPRFASQKNENGAHKLLVYSATAMFLGGLFAIYPPLAPLAIVGLYSLALLWIGLPRIMKTPEEKRFPYMATIVVIWIVAGAVIGAGVGAASGALVKFLPSSSATMSESVQLPSAAALPGGASLDLAEMARLARAAQTGELRPLDPQRLKNFLPQTLPGGFTLTSATSGADAGAHAQGVYANGPLGMTLRILQTGRIGEIAASAPELRSYEGADGYARTNAIDGRLYGESLNTVTGAASYVIIGYGVMLSAEGTGGVLPDQARAAVETVGIQRLERELRN
ncbi:Yip1 family protein [Terricaulis sp.]|uniref:Yip1 family protein n=1 Tax=Terricaulis sp. TaxID=2768686 RepID=UPI0037843CF6